MENKEGEEKKDEKDKDHQSSQDNQENTKEKKEGEKQEFKEENPNGRGTVPYQISEEEAMQILKAMENSEKILPGLGLEKLREKVI